MKNKYKGNKGVSTENITPVSYGVSGKLVKLHIIGNFKNPLVSREQLNWKLGATW